jgi:DNA adenine methylase
MRPPFAYYGGKVGMSPLITSLLPPHRVYIEPFFGAGAVLFAKEPACHEIVNDLDGNVVTFFRVLRERPQDLERVCRLTPYARDEYRAADLTQDLDDLERARRFWVRVNQSFGKTAGVQTGFSVTSARTQSTANSVRGRVDRLLECAERLAAVTIECCDAADLVTRMATTDDAVIYADPPYLAETRRGRDRQRPGDYLCDMGLAEDHERLAEVLRATPATVLLSGYHSPLYDRLYGDWDRIEVAVHVHSSNALTNGRGERTEVIWSNRSLARVEPPAQLWDEPFVAPTTAVDT